MVQRETGARVGRFMDVARVGDVAEGQIVPARADGHKVALALVDGVYHALDDACPHMGAPLSNGWVEHGVVTCPLHFWRFKLEDGTWADNPRLKTGCYAVRVVDDVIQVELPDE